jgi:hypothetical protein
MARHPAIAPRGTSQPGALHTADFIITTWATAVQRRSRHNLNPQGKRKVGLPQRDVNSLSSAAGGQTDAVAGATGWEAFLVFAANPADSANAGAGLWVLAMLVAPPPDPRLRRALGLRPKGGLRNGPLFQASLERVPFLGLDPTAQAAVELPSP